MISIVAVKRDFAKLFSVRREINVQFALNRDFYYVFVFRELHVKGPFYFP